MEPKLSDIMLSISDMNNQVTNFSNRLDLLTYSPTPTKSIFEQSPIVTKAFERAMENLDIDSDDIQNLPKRNPRRSTIYENSMKFKKPLVNESNIQMLYSPIRSDLLLVIQKVHTIYLNKKLYKILLKIYQFLINPRI